MKALKIIIVVVIVAALGFGIYKIVQNKPETPEIEDIDIPEGCEGVVSSAQQLIETRFNAVKDGEFNKLKSVPADLQSFFVGQDIESECMTSVNVIMRNRYLVRFIAMAKNEFSKKTWDWNNFITIEAMDKDFLNEEKVNTDLKEFKTICEEYRKVASYHAKVYGGTKTVGQCEKRPKSIDDRWDDANTQNLINDQPSANEPVKHTTLYENTRKSPVRVSLHDGHVAFIDALVEKAKESIQNNPTEDNYWKVVNKVSDANSEITLYQNNAKSRYDVSTSVVSNNVKRWKGLLTSYQVFVEKEQSQPMTE